MANAIDTSALQNYVNQNAVELLTNTVLGASSLDMFRTIKVTGKTTLNEMDSTITLQDGSACGWNDNGAITFSQRTLDPKPLKVQMGLCHKSFLNKYGEWEMNMTAGKEELPFEEVICNEIVTKVANSIETMLYQGDASNGNEFDGLVKILNAESGVTKLNRTSDIVADVNATYMAINEDALEDSVIVMSKSNFRAYVMALGAKNLYAYDPKIDGDYEFFIPNTSTKIKGVSGLKGSNAIIALKENDVFYGTDNTEGASTFDFWFSKDAQEFRINIQWMSGLQIAFPANYVINQ